MKESGSQGIINHEGIVQKNSGNSVIVSISSVSACSGCHAEGSCNLSGREEKIIEVTGSYDVKPGDNVTILMRQSLGHSAVFLGYFLPFILVITTLIIVHSTKASELVTGLTSIAILIPYYTVLYLFRKRIGRKFTFTLKS
jgi:sigma-E factor negative regulatory protein RseC